MKTFSTILVLLSTFLAVVVANMSYQFADGYDTLLSQPLNPSFTCEGRRYGYYADVANNCQVFHVCLPIPNFEGEIVEMAQFSFVCGNQTVFNQESLTCDHPADAFPCADAANIYELVNSEFGVVNSGERF